MSREWVRDRLLVTVSLVLIGGAAGCLWWVYSLPPTQRNDALQLGGFVLALAGVLVPVVGGLWRTRRPAGSRPVDTLADLLARAVHGQWRQAATERVLVTPPPIPVCWSLCSLPVTGELSAALDGPFTPLPGLAAVTEGQLRAGGGRRELFDVYAGLASGRVVVVGAPGSGKSGSAVLLLLDALAHREGVDGEARGRVPVPVLFTAHGWDPVTCSVQDWLAARLAADYPLFQHPGGLAEATELVAAGAVALILDGLDEMDPAARPAALRALSEASLRVVVLTRSQEMVQAAGDAYLVGAAALHLHDVTGPAGADYLQRARTGPPPSGWTQLLDHLRDQPDSVLARGLSNPLTLTLIRDTYRAGDDVSELLDVGRCGTAEDLEKHLIARILPSVYTYAGSRPKPRYSLSQATQALTFLARQMNHDHTRDLAWWHISRWVPTIPRILASMLAAGLIGGLLSGLIFALEDGIRVGLSTGLNSVPDGLAFGFGVGLPFGLRFGYGGREPKRVKNWRAIRMRAIIATGLLYGPVIGSMVLLVATLVIGPWVQTAAQPVLPLLFGLLSGILFVLISGLKRDFVGQLAEGKGDPQGRRNDWLIALMVMLVCGLASWLVFERLLTAFVLGSVAGLAGWFAARLAGGLAGGLVEGEGGPQGPRHSWRNDRVVGFVVGLAVGFIGGLGFALMVLISVEFMIAGGRQLEFGLAAGLGAALVIGLVIGLMLGITSSVTWPTTLAWLQLQISRRIPVVSLMPFLEDARARGVLRTVGPVYQFRHATLQDQLAAQTPDTDPAPSFAAGRTS